MLNRKKGSVLLFVMGKKKIDKLFKKACDHWDAGNLKEAFELFKEGALLGDAGCQLDLGWFYDYGLYVEQDKDTAFRWYHKAYKGNEIAGALNIGILCKERHEWKKTFWWFYRAVKMGDTETYYEIAKLYQAGHGVKKNIKKAITLYKKAYDSDYIAEHTEEQIEKILKKLNAWDYQ